MTFELNRREEENIMSMNASVNTAGATPVSFDVVREALGRGGHAPSTQDRARYGLAVEG